jgi:pyridoxine 5-phosphate synthase
MKLSVNIDHIATLREARKTNEPDPVYAAALAELNGADGITIHLRQDRRHIQERDLEMLRRVIKSHLNLEMAISMEMVKVALKNKPNTVTLVPESSEEVTTTGGLDVIMFSEKIEEVMSNLRAAGINVSLFIDPDLDQVKACHRLGVRLIEINTGEYANNWNNSYARLELDKIAKVAIYADKLKMRVLAGHGLTYQNVRPIVEINEIDELNIGHTIIANASLVGLPEAVRRMKNLVQREKELPFFRGV